MVQVQDGGASISLGPRVACGAKQTTDLCWKCSLNFKKKKSLLFLSSEWSVPFPLQHTQPSPRPSLHGELPLVILPAPDVCYRPGATPIALFA